MAIMWHSVSVGHRDSMEHSGSKGHSDSMRLSETLSVGLIKLSCLNFRLSLVEYILKSS